MSRLIVMMDSIEPALQAQVEARAAEIVEKIRAWPDCHDFPAPTIYYFDKARSAGKAHPFQYRVAFHVGFLRQNTENMLYETVPHEIAHVFVLWAWQRTFPQFKVPSPHGREWKGVMRKLGVEPERGHHYDMAASGARRQRRWAYACPCQVHRVNTRKHNIMQRGLDRFRCRKCCSHLVLLGEVEK